MTGAFARHGISSRYRVLPIDNYGCRVLAD